MSERNHHNHNHNHKHKEIVIEQLAAGPQKPISESRRFTLLALGSFCCICFSFSYGFNLNATTMQRKYDYTQREMSTINTLGLVFQYFSLPYAFLFDYFGPLPISILSAIFFPVGAVCTALTFMGVIGDSVVRLGVFNAFMGAGSMQFDLVSVMVLYSQFPTTKGVVTALLKTFSGLGSAIVAAMFVGFFHRDPSKYFFFLGAIALTVGVLNLVFMRLPPYVLTGYHQTHLTLEEKESRQQSKTQYLKQEPPKGRFIWGFVVLVLLIVFLPLQGALVAYLKLGDTYTLAFAIVAVILTLGFIGVTLPFFDRFSKKNASKAIEEEEVKEEAVEPAVEDPEAEAALDGFSPTHEDRLSRHGGEADVADAAEVRAAPIETEIDYIAPQYQTSFWRNLLTIELWTLFWTFFVVVGAEFVIIYNATFILEALTSAPVSSSLSALLTVLNGVGSAVGRLLMSFFESWSQRRKAEDRIPITVSLFPTTISIIVTLVLFLVLPGPVLPLPYVLAALGNGFLAATIALVSRTLYAKDQAKHYHFAYFSVMCSSIALNRFLYGEWYSVQAEKQNSKVCHGKGCVLMPLCVLLGLTTSAFLTDIVAHIRYSRYCRRVLKERARLRGEVPEVSVTEEEDDDDKLHNVEMAEAILIEEPLEDGEEVRKDGQVTAEKRNSNSNSSS